MKLNMETKRSFRRFNNNKLWSSINRIIKMEVLDCQLAKSRLRCLILTRKRHKKFNASVILMLKNLLKFR